MAPRALEIAVVSVSALDKEGSAKQQQQDPGAPSTAAIRITSYFEPADPWRLKVELVRAEDVPRPQSSNGSEPHQQQAPGSTPQSQALAVLSVNLPNMPNPGARSFFFKTWGENEGLLEMLVGAGAVRVCNSAGVPVGMVKAMEVELAWPDSDLLVCLETDSQKLQDWQRFFSHTCIQHLGM